jgi:hypothetical protein
MAELSDSYALLDRAKGHFEELRQLWHRERADPMWSISEVQAPDGNYRYQLNFNRPLVHLMRPIMADVANNIVAALDHLVAEFARENGYGRETRTYFPWLFNDELFRTAVRKMAKLTGDQVASAIEDVWFNNGSERPHLHSVKELSNSGKHWELMHSTGGAHAVVIEAPSKRQMFQIPDDAFDDADSFEFGGSDVSIEGLQCYIVLSLSVRGLPDELPSAPDSIFDCSLRFAERILNEVQNRCSC